MQELEQTATIGLAHRIEHETGTDHDENPQFLKIGDATPLRQEVDARAIAPASVEEPQRRG